MRSGCTYVTPILRSSAQTFRRQLFRREVLKFDVNAKPNYKRCRLKFIPLFTQQLPMNSITDICICFCLFFFLSDSTWRIKLANNNKNNNKPYCRIVVNSYEAGKFENLSLVVWIKNLIHLKKKKLRINYENNINSTSLKNYFFLNVPEWIFFEYTVLPGTVLPIYT